MLIIRVLNIFLYNFFNMYKNIYSGKTIMTKYLELIFNIKGKF